MQSHFMSMPWFTQFCSEHLCTFIFRHLSHGLFWTHIYNWCGWVSLWVVHAIAEPCSKKMWGYLVRPPRRARELSSLPWWAEPQAISAVSSSICLDQRSELVWPLSLVVTSKTGWVLLWSRFSFHRSAGWEVISVWQGIWPHHETKLQGKEAVSLSWGWDRQREGETWPSELSDVHVLFLGRGLPSVPISSRPSQGDTSHCRSWWGNQWLLPQRHLPSAWLPPMFAPSWLAALSSGLPSLMHPPDLSCLPFLPCPTYPKHLRVPSSPKYQALSPVRVITACTSLSLEHKSPHKHLLTLLQPAHISWAPSVCITCHYRLNRRNSVILLQLWTEQYFSGGNSSTRLNPHPKESI